MSFQHPDIRRFLVDSIPSRFHNLSPAEFGSFMAFLFRTDGYEVEEIVRKGDAATLLLAKKDNTTLIIRALRYEADQWISDYDLQQANAARSYYETDQSWIITTSAIPDAIKLKAEAFDIELWDWDVFYNALTQLFFDGQSHLDFLDRLQPVMTNEVSDPEIKLKAKWQPEEGISSEWYNLDLVISNPTDRNIYIHLDLPAFIDSKKNQISAEKWAENEFVAGMIYSGASVRTNALFKASRVGERPPGGRVMLTCHERTDPPSTYHLGAKLKGSACYFVTYCYSSESDEYRMMVSFRDDVLEKSPGGRMFISAYYFFSSKLVKWAWHSSFIDWLIRRLTYTVMATYKSRIKQK